MIDRQELYEAVEMFWHTVRWGALVLGVWYLLLYVAGHVIKMLK